MPPRPAPLRQVLDGRWSTVRDDARDVLGGFDLQLDPDLDTEGRRARITGLVRRIADSGRQRHGFLHAYGGNDDIGGAVNLFQIAGHVDLSLMVKAGVQWGLFGGALQSLGTERHHQRHLADTIAFDLPGCFAMTETGHGSNVAGLRTTATYDADAQEFVVHTPDVAARKDYIGNAARDGRMAVVFAQLVTRGESHGVHALLVPIRDARGNPMPGVDIGDCGHKHGLNGLDNGRLMFDHVRVPREALLNRYGDVAPDGTYASPIANPNRRFFTMLGTLVAGRVAVGGAAAAAAQSALAIAVRYGLRRRQFSATREGEEVRLLDYRAHQRRLMIPLATSYALQCAQLELTDLLADVQAAGADRDEAQQRELELRAAGLKAVSTWHATAAIQTAREACGGAGYLSENLLPRLRADSDVFTTFEGDNTVLLQLVAKGLLGGLRDRLRGMDGVATARFYAAAAADVVGEATGARTLAAGLRRADLRDRAVQRGLLADRADHVLAGLGRRLRRSGGSDLDAFVAFNEAQDHVLRAARAWVDLFVFDAIDRAVARVADADTAALLADVRSLYALSTVEADRGWFLEHGRLSRGRAKAVTSTVNDLCARVRVHADVLVDGFGIPEQWLNAAILRGPAVAAPVPVETATLAG